MNWCVCVPLPPPPRRKSASGSAQARTHALFSTYTHALTHQHSYLRHGLITLKYNFQTIRQICERACWCVGALPITTVYRMEIGGGGWSIRGLADCVCVGAVPHLCACNASVNVYHACVCVSVFVQRCRRLDWLPIERVCLYCVSRVRIRVSVCVCVICCVLFVCACVCVYKTSA